MKVVDVWWQSLAWSILVATVSCQRHEEHFHNPGYSSKGDKIYRTSCNCSWGTEIDRKYVSRRNLGFKIVGGTEVRPEENYPMMAGLLYPPMGCIICGASILTVYHVLTAAHCVVEEPPLVLVVGSNSRCGTFQEDGVQYIPLFRKPYVHENYDEDKNTNDIAIVVTEKRIIFNDRVAPTCVHTAPFSSRDDPVLILGWGKLTENGREPDTLNKVYVKTLNIEVCERILPEDWIAENRNTQLCTYRENHKDACTGDSGGPLFFWDPRINRLSQIALVSMGLGCARNDIPAINTALYPFIRWIRGTIYKTTRLLNLNRADIPRSQFCQVIPS